MKIASLAFFILAVLIGSAGLSPVMAQEKLVAEAPTGPIGGAMDEDLIRLLRCTIVDDAPCVEALLAGGASPDIPDEAGMTPLMVAVGAGSVRVATVLIAAGADPLAEGPVGTAANYAMNAGSPEMIRAVVPNSLAMAQTMLLRAAEVGDLAAVAAALDLGADPSAVSPDGATPLLMAMMAGSLPVMKVLLDRGASTEGAQGQAEPLAFAIMAGAATMLDLLLLAGADPNRLLEGIPPLSLAAMGGNLNLIDRLLAAGADHEVTDAAGTRPAAVALAMGNGELVDRLGGAAEPIAPMDIIGSLERGDIAESLKALRAGADPNQLSATGVPALHMALALGNSSLVIVMLAKGADPLATSQDGSSSLHVALAIDDPSLRLDIVSRLLSRARREPLQQQKLFALTDASGRSALVLLAVRLKTPPQLDNSQIQNAINNLISVFDRTSLQSSLSNVDSDGVSPLDAAVLANNPLLLSIVKDFALEMPERTGASLQDLARGRQAWAALAFLPDDRVLPEGLSANSRPEIMLQLQQSLSDWGYYTGAVDGVFGAGSRAALVQLLRDRRDELISIAEADLSGDYGYLMTESPIFLGDADMIAQNGAWYRWIDGIDGGTCIWTLGTWAYNRTEAQSTYIGCLSSRPAGEPLVGNGIALEIFGVAMVGDAISPESGIAEPTIGILEFHTRGGDGIIFQLE